MPYSSVFVLHADSCRKLISVQWPLQLVASILVLRRWMCHIYIGCPSLHQRL